LSQTNFLLSGLDSFSLICLFFFWFLGSKIINFQNEMRLFLGSEEVYYIGPSWKIGYELFIIIIFRLSVSNLHFQVCYYQIGSTLFSFCVKYGKFHLNSFLTERFLCRHPVWGKFNKMFTCKFKDNCIFSDLSNLLSLFTSEQSLLLIKVFCIQMRLF